MERDQILKQCCQMFGGEKAQKTFLDPGRKIFKLFFYILQTSLPKNVFYISFQCCIMGYEKMQLQKERKGVFVCVWWGSVKNVFVKFSNPYTFLLFETGTETCACVSL